VAAALLAVMVLPGSGLVEPAGVGATAALSALPPEPELWRPELGLDQELALIQRLQSPPTHSQVRFGWPLPEPLVVARVFDGPAQQWLAGHRGVDLVGPVAAPVLAPAAGTVSFNGWIVDRHVVVIDHGALRSTLEPVLSDLPVGAALLRGQVDGRLATEEVAHCPSCLHWGVRQGQDYLDPTRLVGAHPRAVLWQ